MLPWEAEEAAGQSTGTRKLESNGDAAETEAKIRKIGENVKRVFR